MIEIITATEALKQTKQAILDNEDKNLEYIYSLIKTNISEGKSSLHIPDIVIGSKVKDILREKGYIITSLHEKLGTVVCISWE